MKIGNETSACFLSSMKNRNLKSIIITIRVISLQALDIYSVWSAKRTASHNYKRQGRLVSEKPMVEQPITHKIMVKKTMTILRESAQESDAKNSFRNQENPNCIYPSREQQLCSVLLSKRKADVPFCPCWGGFHL